LSVSTLPGSIRLRGGKYCRIDSHPISPIRRNAEFNGAVNFWRRNPQAREDCMKPAVKPNSCVRSRINGMSRKLPGFRALAQAAFAARALRQSWSIRRIPSHALILLELRDCLLQICFEDFHERREQ